ncbi:antifreeze protein [Maritimibacter dapengensis]|uniref:Antifreeze protein n=1 Tax=Maritimibacter dapengensis TaxID=2836868 RepID=A0ABS6SX53_9RHOB|nr:antifreeze protein [Maritimibacter dapengensis]MBV7377544.1 antifreeze protein [Maritimibacter dapengensis]
MARLPTYWDAWANALQAGMIVAEAQAVIAMRLWGMAGMWSVTPYENTRMVSEKAGAWTRAMLSAGIAATNGGDVAKAAMRPVRAKTKSNARRLAKRGPKVRR